MKKLPLINAQYWAFIISATTLGETGADVISQSLSLGYGTATLVFLASFIVVLGVEIVAKAQHRSLYWLVITLASLMGTTISDFVTRTLGLGYGWGTLLVASILTVIFYVWRKLARHVSVQGGFDVKTEVLYWAAILVSSTLGTALGDYISDATPLGFGGGALLLFLLLVLIALVVIFTKVSREMLYWQAIVVTHPMGATLGDFMTKESGLNLGNVSASLLVLCIFALVTIISISACHPKERL